MTTFGFWLLDAESRYTSRWPLISWSRIGKSARRACASKARVAVVVSMAIGRPAALAADLHGLGLEIGTLGHEEGLVRRIHGQSGLAQDRAVALVLEPEGEVLAAGLDDAALGQDVDDVGLDVVQQALVVGDEEHAEVRVEHRVDALRDDAQRVDVEA